MSDRYDPRYDDGFDDDYDFGYGYDDQRPPPPPPARGVARVPPEPIPPRPPREPVDESDPLSLIPGPDETTLLPRLPGRGERGPEPDPEVPEARRRRAIRRHRDDPAASGAGGRRAVRVFAEVFVTLGAVVLLFSAYMIWGTSAEITAAQDEKETELIEDWADAEEDPTLDPLPGEAIARLYMPQIRPEPWIIVEGTDLDDIETAPGHFEDSAMPGETGNFALAGHNVPAIFRHIDVLKAGDVVVVETMSNFYIYEITESAILSPTALEAVAPVPNQPGVEPGEDDRWLTLMTCHPWWDNYERYFVWGNLLDTRERGDELPPEALG
ncbi:sortase A [Stackebrandtia albiflava]|uniref:Sortase A n=1 Tax=Stackebrandtia albiflava TaxID=406432 RepID=A0A562V269_9ACTN|nr:class E sortase [Stackebrandtia albiflava]TWJ11989.1 sortase A [Stackebrandtia albiflava]